MLICGYAEYARFSVLDWDGNKYIEKKRALLKTVGRTKHFIITTLKKSKFVKMQFYCVINKDLCRVTLDYQMHGKAAGMVHPKDTLFRGEFNIVDFK